MSQCKQNYQLYLDKTLCNIAESGIRPSLLLHACCAPCSSYVLEYLARYFDITLFFYNPNISPKEEHELRYSELCRLVGDMGLSPEINVIRADYEPEKFFAVARGLEQLPEGDARCRRCYALRLEKTAEAAKEANFDYFTTTLSISPHKNAEWLCEIGKELSDKYGVSYLFSDFKKRGGYKRSCELSVQYKLYRQSFCGCIYSKQAAQARQNRK